MVNAEWMAIGVRLGMLDLVRTDQEHTLFLGPDILDPAFDPGAANLAGSGTSIGAALLDQLRPCPLRASLPAVRRDHPGGTHRTTHQGTRPVLLPGLSGWAGPRRPRNDLAARRNRNRPQAPAPS